MTSARGLVAAALVVGGGACGDASGGGSRAVVERDSAGVTIVENPALPDSGGALAFAAEPDVTIGVLEGAPEYQLHEVISAVRLSDGRIVVANGGTHELRWYDESGRHLYTAGRQGQGPGEFEGMGDLWRLPGDSVVVFDWNTRRLSLFDHRGEFVSSHPLGSAADGMAYPIGMLTSEIALLRGGIAMVDREAGEGVRPQRLPLRLLHWRSDDARSDSLMTVDGGDWFTGTVSGGPLYYMPVFLAPIPSVSAIGGAIYRGVAERYEIEVYDSTGGLRRLIRVAHERMPLSAEEIERRTQEYLERMGSERARSMQAQLLEKMPKPKYAPAHGRVFADELGRVWVFRWTAGRGGMPGSNDSGATWDVFDREGRWLAVVRTPANFGIRDVGEDWVLGVSRDEFDVEQVRMYRLTRAVES